MALVTPHEVEYQLAHKADNRSAVLYGTAISMIILTAGAVLVRLGCRWHLKSRVSYDDIAILVAMVRLSVMISEDN